MAKNNQSTIKPVPRAAIADVRGETDFVELLRRELSWPIPERLERLDEVVIPLDLQQDFGFPAGEDRIRVSRLFNLSEDQPWGIFLFEFKTKRPYLTHLRRLLRVLGSRRTLREGDPIWNRSDLLFICTRDWIEYQFVHFAGEKPESAVISSFGWTGPEDPFLHTLCKHNLPQIRLPEPDDAGKIDPEKWRGQWSDAFNIKPVTDEFYRTLKEVFDAVQAGVKGLKGENRRFFAELLVNRLIFLKFVEKKGWLDGDADYLFNRFKQHGRKNYWRNFLFHFFFEGLNTEPKHRTSKVKDLLGDVPFLNAELFAKADEWDDETVEVVNNVFDLLFDKLLNPYNFTVCETSPLDVEVAFNQDLLGYGYEELIADQHGQGAYYTHPTEVNLMCRESLRAYLEARCPDVDKVIIGKLVYGELSIAGSAGPSLQKDLLYLYQALHDVTIVDPAVGSGSFPVALMKHLFLCLTTLGGILKDAEAFQTKIKSQELTDPANAFRLKLHIIEKSLYGCDIDYFAVQIAKLRFWIELMVNCDVPTALPNFDFKLVVGDALVSVVGTAPDGKPVALENILGHPTKGQLSLNKIYVDQYAELKREYFAVKDSGERENLRAQIEEAKEQLLVNLGISIPKARRTDKHVLWQIDFAEIFSGESPGFDIAIANPPYLRQELIDQTLHEFSLAVKKNDLLSLYKALSGEPISGKSDIYIFFFYRAQMLTKLDAGILCFICSNSWLDVEYGWSLQRYLAANVMIIGIIESCTTRSFENADINTSICLFQNSASKDERQARFISLSSDYSPPDTGTFFTQLFHTTRSIRTPGYSVRVVNSSRLTNHVTSKAGETGGKWGGIFLRAPSIFDTILDRCHSVLVPLRDIATVEFGLKTGANSFFLLTEEVVRQWGIENKYIRRLIKSPQHVLKYILDDKTRTTMILFCPYPKSELKGSGVLEYIKWGERLGVQNAPSVRSHSPWWFVGQETAPDAIWFKAFHNRFIYPINTFKLLVSDRFYKITMKKRYQPTSIAASLNNAFTILSTELMGRTSLGEGALDNMTYEAASNLVFNPAIMPSNIRIPERQVLPIDKELMESDRREFDEIVFKAVGLTPHHVDAVYEAIERMVNTRLKRARSLNNGD